MKRYRIAAAVATTAILLAGGLSAAENQSGGTTSAKPVQLALVPAFQLVPQNESIQGLRLNIYGCNQDVSGVDIGLLHETAGNFRGVGFGLLNAVHGECRGLQFGGIYNEGKIRMSGLQVGIVNRSESANGLQIGLANFADDMTGIQIGLWNEIKNKERLTVLPIINAAF